MKKQKAVKVEAFWLINTSNVHGYLLVSSFMRPSSMLTERCALWDSCETVELSVLTPEVTTMSSWAVTVGARLWFLSGSPSSSTSSWSAASLSEARLKWGLSSEHTHKTHYFNKWLRFVLWKWRVSLILMLHWDQIPDRPTMLAFCLKNMILTQSTCRFMVLRSNVWFHFLVQHFLTKWSHPIV